MDEAFADQRGCLLQPVRADSTPPPTPMHTWPSPVLGPARSGCLWGRLLASLEPAPGLPGSLWPGPRHFTSLSYEEARQDLGRGSPLTLSTNPAPTSSVHHAVPAPAQATENGDRRVTELEVKAIIVAKAGAASEKYIIACSVLKTPLRWGRYYPLHFRDAAEAQRGWAACLKSHSSEAVEVGLEKDSSRSRCGSPDLQGK